MSVAPRVHAIPGDVDRQLATIKDELRQFWEQRTKTAAAKFLDDWCRRAEATGICVLRTMSNTLRGHRTGLLNWYDYPISTGPVEGTNNKIKLLQRRAYGYRSYAKIVVVIDEQKLDLAGIEALIQRAVELMADLSCREPD